MKYLIDTCVISELSVRKPSSGVVRWFSETPDGDMYLSVITIGELRKGIDRLKLDDPRRVKLEKWLAVVRTVFYGRILPFVEETAVAWGEIVGESLRTGKARPIVDAQIAATALMNGMTLVSRNAKDFSGTGVQLFNPFD